MERTGVCGALLRSALACPDPQLHRAPRVQVQALRELQAIAEGDSVFSSAQRQQQLSDELFPELPTLAALVQDRRPATARQACTTIESLAESLQGAFDPLVMPLLPPLLVVASSSTPAIARSAEGGVITIMRGCAPERITALLCWASGGLATGIWEEAPDFRSTPDAIVRRQSLWLVLMLLELAEADSEVDVEALARQISDALDVAELSKRAETRAIGQHGEATLAMQIPCCCLNSTARSSQMRLCMCMQLGRCCSGAWPARVTPRLHQTSFGLRRILHGARRARSRCHQQSTPHHLDARAGAPRLSQRSTKHTFHLTTKVY